MCGANRKLLKGTGSGEWKTFVKVFYSPDAGGIFYLKDSIAFLKPSRERSITSVPTQKARRK